jgi:hypothetical protein
VLLSSERILVNTLLIDASSSMINIFDIMFYLTAKFVMFFAMLVKIQICYFISPDCREILAFFGEIETESGNRVC